MDDNQQAAIQANLQSVLSSIGITLQVPVTFISVPGGPKGIALQVVIDDVALASGGVSSGDSEIDDMFNQIASSLEQDKRNEKQREFENRIAEVRKELGLEPEGFDGQDG